ncbi:uncharacterized protein F4822DRAFT_442375 [Hypoxylon trugodes]|uniref:uncharacterized protein n=1 Tax=Hypoxylon trugodes TaxID=326681 RepID=UPI00219B816A|nr:uncharacterized protein F4822DRAFT_442375 [Hypoxylon trugodes]KAI1391351.1 hypothetical protein F4822DRAFT_442375 [Hypoxylon trugodes]
MCQVYWYHTYCRRPGCGQEISRRERHDLCPEAQAARHVGRCRIGVRWVDPVHKRKRRVRCSYCQLVNDNNEGEDNIPYENTDDEDNVIFSDTESNTESVDQDNLTNGQTTINGQGVNGQVNGQAVNGEVNDSESDSQDDNDPVVNGQLTNGVNGVNGDLTNGYEED